ncbi:MAG: M56 family metallopeptidase [Planctomycetes bacterium]|nr:M56 family metallopeptidase [Planctomycetota bacterium]
MDALLHAWITSVNDVGCAFCNHVVAVFVQSGVLIIVLLSIDLLLRRRLRATVRYWIWMLVFLKLILPPSLSLPTGVGYWIGRYIPLSMLVLPQVSEATAIPAAFPESLVMEVRAIGDRGADVAPTPRARLTWQGGVFLLWGAGVLALASCVWRRLRFVKGLRARATPAEGLPLELLDQCRRRLGVRRQIEMRVASHLCSPAVCGLWRPTILMPAALLAELPPEKLRAILIHELAHVRRADLWVNCLQTGFQIAYFYNPLVWLANAIVRRVREQAVDEMVLVALGAEAGSYSGTLVDIAEMAFLRAGSALGLVGVAESKKSLEGRIRHMLNRPIPKSGRVGVVGVLVIVLAGALLLPMAAAQTRTSAAESVTAQGAPELPPGIAELFGLSKHDLLAKYGRPSTIFYGQNQYSLDNLPQRYFMIFGEQGLSFGMEADRVTGITLLSPAHVFGNGVRVGDPEAKVKEAFGPDYVIEESKIKDFLIYRQFDLSFEVYKPDRIVREINIGGSYGAAGRARQKMGRAGAEQANVSALPPGIAGLFGLSKNDMLAKFGQPEAIFYGGKQYTLDNLPEQYYMNFREPRLSFRIRANRVVEVTLLGPAFVFGNGVRVGDSEDKVKRAFGPDYVVKESRIKDFLIYRQLDLSFEVYKPDRIVREINIGDTYGRRDQSEQRRGEGQRADRVNLSAIGKACLAYADTHEDRLPPDLQTLVKEMDLSPGVLESAHKPQDFKGPSYIYIPGQTVEMYPVNIVAYANPEFCADGVNVLHLDSHVEFMKPEAFRRELKETYGRLGQPMPEVKFQD